MKSNNSSLKISPNRHLLVPEVTDPQILHYNSEQAIFLNPGGSLFFKSAGTRKSNPTLYSHELKTCWKLWKFIWYYNILFLGGGSPPKSLVFKSLRAKNSYYEVPGADSWRLPLLKLMLVGKTQSAVILPEERGYIPGRERLYSRKSTVILPCHWFTNPTK